MANPQISIAAKKRYFLNYIGQYYIRFLVQPDYQTKIVCPKKVGPYKLDFEHVGKIDYFFKEAFPETESATDILLLRSTQMMTDAEAFTACRYNYTPFYDSEPSPTLVRMGRDVLNAPHTTHKCIEYLRSIGVATPLFDPETGETFNVGELIAGNVLLFDFN